MKRNPKYKFGDLVQAGDSKVMRVLEVGVYSLNILDSPKPCALCQWDHDKEASLPKCGWFYCDDLKPAKEAARG